MNKCHFKIDTRLCNMDNQTDSNDATWILINPHNSSCTVNAHLTEMMHLKVQLFQRETCIVGIV